MFVYGALQLLFLKEPRTSLLPMKQNTACPDRRSPKVSTNSTTASISKKLIWASSRCNSWLVTLPGTTKAVQYQILSEHTTAAKPSSSPQASVQAQTVSLVFVSTDSLTARASERNLIHHSAAFFLSDGDIPNPGIGALASVLHAANLEILHYLCVVLSDDVEDTSRNEDVDFKLEALSRLTAHGSRALYNDASPNSWS